MKFHHTAAPATRLPMRNRRMLRNVCLCRDCSNGRGLTRAQENREWRRGIIVPHGRVRA